MMQDMNDTCDDDLLGMLEEEKRVLDEKVDKSKFAFLVLKQKYYRELTETMRLMNEQVDADLAESRQMLSAVVSFDADEEAIKKILADLLDKSIKVDEKRSGGNVQVNSEDSVFHFKRNSLCVSDFVKKKTDTLDTFTELFYAKVLALNDSSLLLVGGQSEPDYGRNTVIKRTCL